MRLDRDHYQRIEAVRNVTGDDMEHFLFAPNGELEDLILDYLGFPADGTPIKGGGKFSRNAWDWEYHEMLAGGLPHFFDVGDVVRGGVRVSYSADLSTKSPRYRFRGNLVAHLNEFSRNLTFPFIPATAISDLHYAS